MAKLTDGITFTGFLGGLSAYKMRGSDKIILRQPGGMTKEQIKRLPETSLIKLNNSEWSACAKASREVRDAMGQLRVLAGYNLAGPMNAMAKAIQKLDPVNVWGKRSVAYSAHRYMLEGFNLNRQNIFDSVVRSPVQVGIERETGSATITLPQMVKGVNLVLPWKWPVYRFLINLGVLPDMVYNEAAKRYGDPHRRMIPYVDTYKTEWHSAQKSFPGQTADLQLQRVETMPDPSSLLVTVGIQMGNMISADQVDPVKYASCAKVLAVV